METYRPRKFLTMLTKISNLYGKKKFTHFDWFYFESIQEHHVHRWVMTNRDINFFLHYICFF
jgi:hypothetical protein